jgi:hypothetical protein
MSAFLSGFQKAADVSKAELRAELKKHEDRETPAQEAAESPKEQDIERRAGVEKHADPEAGYRAPDEKYAGLFGPSAAKRAAGHQDAVEAYHHQVHSMGQDAGVPLPEHFRDHGMTPEKHHTSVHGYNHFSDKFNAWLPSDEGEKWNNEQAAKHREKNAFARGFEKAAAGAVFNIKAKEPAMVMRVQQYLRRLVGNGGRRRRIAKK